MAEGAIHFRDVAKIEPDIGAARDGLLHAGEGFLSPAQTESDDAEEMQDVRVIRCDGKRACEQAVGEGVFLLGFQTRGE